MRSGLAGVSTHRADGYIQGRARSTTASLPALAAQPVWASPCPLWTLVNLVLVPPCLRGTCHVKFSV